MIEFLSTFLSIHISNILMLIRVSLLNIESIKCEALAGVPYCHSEFCLHAEIHLGTVSALNTHEQII